MRHSVEVKHDEKFIEVTLDGEASLEGLVRYFSDMLKPPYVDLELPVLIDMRSLAVRRITGDNIKELVQIVGDQRHLMKPVKSALVVGSPTAFGFARMYELMAQDTDPQTNCVFYDYDEARAWVLDRNPVFS